MLANGGSLEIVDDGARRGYAVFRDGQLDMLGATDDETAPHAAVAGRWPRPRRRPRSDCLTAAQDWAVEVASRRGSRCQAGRAAVRVGRRLRSGSARPGFLTGWYFLRLRGTWSPR